MRDWPGDEVRPVGLTDLDGRFSRYRLQASAESRRALEQSLRRYGQLSPVVVCCWDGCVVLLDGFKRWEAARAIDGIQELLARRIEADQRAAKAAMYGLNCLTRRLHELEEAWIVQALVPLGGFLLAGVALAQLLAYAAGRDPLPRDGAADETAAEPKPPASVE